MLADVASGTNVEKSRSHEGDHAHVPVQYDVSGCPRIWASQEANELHDEQSLRGARAWAKVS